VIRTSKRRRLGAYWIATDHMTGLQRQRFGMYILNPMPVVMSGRQALSNFSGFAAGNQAEAVNTIHVDQAVGIVGRRDISIPDSSAAIWQSNAAHAEAYRALMDECSAVGKSVGLVAEVSGTGGICGSGGAFLPDRARTPMPQSLILTSQFNSGVLAAIDSGCLASRYCCVLPRRLLAPVALYTGHLLI